MLKQEKSLTNYLSSNKDTRRPSSFFTSQSMGTKDICILVVHDDPMHHNIIQEMLENCSHYEVMKFKSTADALNIIQERKELLNIVLTDVHRSHSNGFEILNYIEREYKLPAISMNLRQNARIVPLGLDTDAKLYFVKSLNVNEFKILWHHAYTKERGKTPSFLSVSEIQEKETGTSLGSKSPVCEVTREDQTSKKIKFEETGEQSDEDKDESPSEKKQRVMWNEPMHHKFLKAVQFLGHDRAFPKKILEVMNVPGLTRENVASHLQKYRLCLKRAQEEMQITRSIFGNNLSQPDFNPSNTNQLQYNNQKKLLQSYEQRLSPFNISSSSYPETSNSTSNIGQQPFLYARNSFLDSKTQSNTTCPINMPLSNLYSNNLESSSSTTNLAKQSFFNPDSYTSSFLYNSTLNATTQTHSIPLTNENTQPDSLNNTSYVGLKMTGNGELAECGQPSAQNINANTTENANALNDRNENESLAPFPSTEMNNNSEFYVPAAECEIEDLLDEVVSVTTSADIKFDFDDSLLDHI